MLIKKDPRWTGSLSLNEIYKCVAHTTTVKKVDHESKIKTQICVKKRFNSLLLSTNIELFRTLDFELTP